MDDTHLETVGAIVDVLGGTGAVAILAKNTDAAVSNWRRAGKFPANTYFLIKDELDKIGKTAPNSLFAMKTAATS